MEISPETSLQNLEALRKRLPQGSRVFVNMVKTSAEHFEEVARCVASVRSRGLRPVAHVPLARLETQQQARQVLSNLATAGAQDLLLVAGNDLPQRRHLVAYGSVGQLLEEELGGLKALGVRGVALAGLPDGPDEELGRQVLLQKACLGRRKGSLRAGEAPGA